MIEASDIPLKIKMERPPFKRKKLLKQEIKPEVPLFKRKKLLKQEIKPEVAKWTTLSHRGPLFPPAYEAHGVKMLYNGQEIDLIPEQEEVASFYSKYLETDHVKKPQFRKNFFKDFLKVLNSGRKRGEPKHIIRKLDLCDFTPILLHLKQTAELRRNRTKEEKRAEKEEKEKLREVYGYALVDGKRERIGNYMVEPPGLFLGRGDHPKTGQLKHRIMPEDVTINIGRNESIPEPPLKGHSWKEVVHNPEVTWLAFWRENINNAFKYVWLHNTSAIKGESDLKKYETASKLKDHIDRIRGKYFKDLRSKELPIRQRAVVLWLIDNLALRVGNEKGKDEADTVGCCSLRCEHVKLEEPDIVLFDFLGKDSMRYQNTCHVHPLVFKNMQSFILNKRPDEHIFDKMSVTLLNNHLKNGMPGLSGKVFRTYNASITLQNELQKADFSHHDKKLTEKAPASLRNMVLLKKVMFYIEANRKVAILCNHRRTVKEETFIQQVERLNVNLKFLKKEKKNLQVHLRNLQALEKMTKKEKDNSLQLNETYTYGPQDKLKRFPKTVLLTKKAIERLNERITRVNLKNKEKHDLKEVALGTSKINYMDPRITVAWCKKHNIPVNKCFSKTLQEKFTWALNVEKDFIF